jgi:SAM-dependent methyltransferase
MNDADPVGLLFGGMEKLGPGGDAHTLHVLRLLPRRDFGLVVDAGCGTGRQTLALAGALRTRVHALDSYEPFLAELRRRAGEAGLDDLVQTHALDMRDIPEVFKDIELLWSEGAAYNIGFAGALATWAPALAPDGLLVVSELTWLKEQRPDEAVEYFRSVYPAMQTVEENVAAAEAAGYDVLAMYTLPGQAWIDGYYDVLGPRARILSGHADASVREFAADALREIEIFERSEGSYGYVFLALQQKGETAPRAGYR